MSHCHFWSMSMHGQVCAYSNIFLYCISSLAFRGCILASVYHCHSCNGSWKSSNNISYILHHQSMQGTKLLPSCEDNTHIKANTWTDIHTRDKLDVDAAMPCCCYRISRYWHDWKCIWFLPSRLIFLNVLPFACSLIRHSAFCFCLHRPCCDHSHVCYNLLDVFDHHCCLERKCCPGINVCTNLWISGTALFFCMPC